MNAYTRRNVLRRWGWNLRHPKAEVYDLSFDIYPTPVLQQRIVSVPHNYGLQLLPRGRGGWSDPRPVLLHGLGNSVAIRVLDFTVVEQSNASTASVDK